MTDPKQTRSPLPILVTLVAATLTASLGISIASVLLPTLTRYFSASVSDVQWVVLAYLMSVTLTIVSAGRLADLFGQRRVLVNGFVIFLTASVLCATAPSLGVLIAARTVQGLGGAILIALSLSTARELVPQEQLGSAMGLLGTTSAIGTALGPSLSGILLAWGDWRLPFWGLIGLSVLAMALSMVFLPVNTAQREVSLKQLDIPGTGILMFALASYALATSSGDGQVLVPPETLVIVSLVAFALFVIVEKKSASPLIPTALICNRVTGLGFVMNLLVGTIMMSTLVVGPFFLAFSLGLNDALIGMVLAVGPVASALAGIPAGKITDSLGANRVLVIGLAQMLIGLLCLAYLPLFFGTGGYLVALLMLTPSFQLFLAANNTAVLADAPKEQRGRLSGLLGLSRNLGLMTGTSAMSTVFVTMLGTGDVAQAPAADVARAFSLTFIAAAGLAVGALGLAMCSQAYRAPVNHCSACRPSIKNPRPDNAR